MSRQFWINENTLGKCFRSSRSSDGPRISLKLVYTIDSKHAYVIKVLFSLLDTFRKLGWFYISFYSSCFQEVKDRMIFGV